MATAKATGDFSARTKTAGKSAHSTAAKKTTAKPSATKKSAATKAATEKSTIAKTPVKKTARAATTAPKPAAKKAAAKKAGGRKYSSAASEQVGQELHEMHRGRLRSSSGQTVTNPKQAIAIALSEARRAGKKVPPDPNDPKKK